MNYLLFCLLFIFIQFSHQIEKKKLPDNATPYSYEIDMFPPMNSNVFTFEGESKISLKISKPTVNLTLHSFNLTISYEHTKITNDYGVILKPRNHFFDLESQFLILNFENELQPGFYNLYLKYSGKIKEEFKSTESGFFRRRHMNGTLISTNFKAPHARQTFPCWDEPSIKANFHIWIKRLPNQSAMSNMPLTGIVDQTMKDGYMWSVFGATPPMSTNMISIVVTDFRDDINNGHSSHPKFIMVSNKEFVINGFHNLKRGVNVISMFEKYIGIKYHLPSIFLLAILEDNQEPLGTCGLIIDRELHIPTENYLGDKEEVESYVKVMYEFSRQWFGCLITPAEPSDTWITEGLLFYMSHFIFDKMDFSTSEEFIRKQASIEALNININLYDASIVEEGNLKKYRIKAEAIMHMISGLLTETVFHAAIKNMLEIYKYKTITTDQFWSILQKELTKSQLPRNNFNLRMYMEPYIVQEGYPIVNVKRDYSCNTLSMTQTSSVETKTSANKKWWIPINIGSSYTLDFSLTFAKNWINPHDEKLIIDGLTFDDWWYIVNVQNFGLYRVNYDERNWNRIVDYLNSKYYKNINILNRMKIVDDFLFFNRTNRFSNHIIMGIDKYVQNENNRTVLNL